MDDRHLRETSIADDQFLRHTDHQGDYNDNYNYFYYYRKCLYWMISTASTDTKWSPTGLQLLLLLNDDQLTTNTTTIAASIWWSVSLPTSHWSQQWVANTASGRTRCVRNSPHSCVLANLICAKVANCVCIKRVGLSHKNIVNFSQISANTNNSKIIQVLSKIIVSGSRWLSC